MSPHDVPQEFLMSKAPFMVLPPLSVCDFCGIIEANCVNAWPPATMIILILKR